MVISTADSRPVGVSQTALRLTSSPLEPCAPCSHHEIRPPTPRSEATARAVTRGNITELAATAVVVRLIDLSPVRIIGYNENSAAAERVSVNLH